MLVFICMMLPVDVDTSSSGAYMDHDFYERASDAPLRAPDGFSEMAAAAGVAASVAERNEMMAYALETFSRGHD